MPRHSFWSGLAVIGFALLALNWIIPNYAGVNPFAQMPPDLVPRIASWIMLVSASIVVVQASIEMVRAGQKPIALDIDWPDLGWKLWPFAYVTAGIYFLTFFKVTYVGVPLIAGMLFLLGERRWYIILGCSVTPVVLLYILSVYMMRVGVI